MGRPERPLNPQDGPVQLLAWQLRRLRATAGGPSYRRLAQRAHYSASTLADAAMGERLPSLEVTLAYAAACGGDAEEWRTRWTTAADSLAAAPPDGPDDEAPAPYRGLLPFEAEDAAWFYGRDDLVRRLVDRVGRRPLVAVFGASGSGKSSLLRAGLVGATAGDDAWRVMLMTPGDRPVDALADVVAKVSERDVRSTRDDLRADPAAADVVIRAALPPGVRALLVVDQFEEIFTLCADDGERQRFVDTLLDVAVGEGRRTTVVLGVRADFLAHVTRLPRLLDALGDSQLLVGPPSPGELRAMVVAPAERAGLVVDDDLVATVLAAAGAEPGALPLLSHALRETWRGRTGPRLTLAGYHAAGGLATAIARTAEGLYTELDGTERTALRRILLRLSALGDGTDDTRRPIARAELDGVAEPAVVDRVLGRLADGRLVVLGQNRVEMAHEALIRAWPRLHRWLGDDRDDLRAHRRLTEAADTWQRLDRDPGALYRGAQLAAARTWSDDHRHELNAVEAAFVDASVTQADATEAASRRRTRTLKRLVAALATFLVLAVAGGAVAVWQRGVAAERQRVASAHQLALTARSLVATDPVLAGRLAAEAYRRHPDPETRGAAVSAAALGEPRVEIDPGGQAKFGVAVSPDGTLVASGSADGRIVLWNAGTGAERSTVARYDELYGRRVAFSADGSRLVSTATEPPGGQDRSVVLVSDVATGAAVRELRRTATTQDVALTRDGRTVAFGYRDGRVEVVDVASGRGRVWTAHAARTQSLGFSADGALLVTASATDGGPVVWDAATGARIAELPVTRVHTVGFAPDGRTVTAATEHTGVTAWDVTTATPRKVYELANPTPYVWGASEPRAGHLAIVDHDGIITVWDTTTRMPVATYRDRYGVEALAVALSPDGSVLASVGFDGTIVVRHRPVPPFAGHGAAVTDIAVAPDGRVATAGRDRTVRIWTADGRPLATLADHPDTVEAVAFSPDGRTLAAATRDNSLVVWSAGTGARLATVPFEGIGTASDVAFGPSGEVLAASLKRFRWDLTDPAHPREVPFAAAALVASRVEPSADGRFIVSASPTGGVFFWAAADDRRLHLFDGGRGSVLDIALGPDDRVLAVAGADRTVRLIDTTSYAVTATLEGHTAPVHAVAFSRDGRRLASAGQDGEILVRDLATGATTTRLTGHADAVRTLAFAADGALLSGGADGRVVRWDLDADAAVARLCAVSGC